MIATIDKPQIAINITAPKQNKLAATVLVRAFGMDQSNLQVQNARSTASTEVNMASRP